MKLSIGGVLSAIISLLPLLAAFIIFLTARRSRKGDIFARASAAFMIFWIVYCMFSAVFFTLMGRTPDTILVANNLNYRVLAGILTLMLVESVHAAVVAVIYYPLFVYPVICIMAPLLSLIILGMSIGVKGLQEVEVWVDLGESEGGWKEEVEILKLCAVSLPVSLYFLIGILRISGYEENPLAVGTTALGWIIEVFVVILLTLICGIHVLYAARVYHRGVFLGEMLRNRIFRGFLIVGLIMSLMSIITFLQTYPIAVYTLLYFSMYYMMVIGIFLLFFRFLEPITIYIFAKIVSMIRGAGREHELSPYSLAISVLCAVTSVVLAAIFMHMVMLAFWQEYALQISRDIMKCLITSAATIDSIVNVCTALTLSALQILLGILLIVAISLATKRILLGRGVILLALLTGIAKAVADVLMINVSVSLLWEVFVFSRIETPSLTIMVPRSAFLQMDPVLRTALVALFFPYEVLRSASTTIVLILAVYLFGRWVKTFRVREDGVTSICLCEHDGIVDASTLVKISEDAEILAVEEDLSEDEAKFFEILRSRRILRLEKISKMTGISMADAKRIAYSLKRRGLIELFSCDLEIRTPHPKILGLYVVSNEGLPLYSEVFAEEIIEPALVSGMFSAISSFLKEAVRSTERLRKIDHGDIIIILEYGSRFFSALIVDRETPEVRLKLRTFVEQFERKFGALIKEGFVDTSQFADARQMFREIFGEFL